MAIVDIGMTQDDVEAAGAPAPEDDYLLTFEGFLLNEENRGDVNKPEDPFILWPTKKGGKMVKAKFIIESDDPKAAGKRLIYMGTIPNFSFINLCKALPIMSETGIDDEKAIGRQIKAHVIVTTYTDPETGKTSEPKNEIDGKFTAA